ncbi:MAG: exopolysaccharide biosynthesis polyprenyl glycosylphosphotransferase [Victivallales bacterium]|nr:exopolysaccharide biosynthesis polyprenyl glycosylphosphotransferase [Victivallales bacterium]
MKKKGDILKYDIKFPWLRNCLLVLSDLVAIIIPGVILNLVANWITGSVLCSYTTLVIFMLAFVVTGEKVKLYNGCFFSPGFPLAPQEELRRMFYVLMGLLTIRLFHFPEFPILVSIGNLKSSTDYLVKIILTYLPLPFIFFSMIWLRWLARTLMVRLKMGMTPVAVWGAGKSGQLLVDILKKSRYHGLTPIIILDDDPKKSGTFINGIPVRRFDNKVKNLLKGAQITHVILCLPFEFLIDKVKACNNVFKQVSILGAVHDFPNSGSYLHDLYGLTIVEYRSGLRVPVNIFCRYCLNTVLSFCAIIIFLPLMLLIAAIVKITSPGPVLYRARRLGKNGKDIHIYKFRTMYHDAAERLEELLEENPALKKEWEKSFKLKNDPRITPVGAFLRKTSMDELPQILSVIKGELNLVGPRPIVAGEIKYYGKDYALVSSVSPGLTGMWQVSGRSNTSYDERVLLEKYYVLNWSPWLDIYIIIKTVLEVILCRGAY